MNDDQPELAGLIDHETDARRVLNRAVAAFVEVLAQDLTGDQAMELATTSHQHGGVLAFNSGGLVLGIAVEFSEPLSADETRAAELNAQSSPEHRVFVRKGRGLI